MSGNKSKIDSLKPKDIAGLISQFFHECDSHNPKLPYTITGIAFALKVNTSDIIRYPEDGKYIEIINRAKLSCEKDLIERMFTGKIDKTTAALLLKNHFGYSDRENKPPAPEAPSTKKKTISELLNEQE